MCDNNYVDFEGDGCQTYHDAEWCTATGEYGPEWNTAEGHTFAAYPDPSTGLTALSCELCGCGIYYCSIF